MSETVKIVLSFAFDQVEVGKVSILTNPENIAVHKIAKKFNFHFVGVLKDLLQDLNGGWQDRSFYTLTKEDYFRSI